MKLTATLVLVGILFTPLTPALAQKPPKTCDTPTVPSFSVQVPASEATALIAGLKPNATSRIRLHGLPLTINTKNGIMCITHMANFVLPTQLCNNIQALFPGFTLTSGNGFAIPAGALPGVLLAPQEIIAPEQLLQSLGTRIRELQKEPSRTKAQDAELRLRLIARDAMTSFVPGSDTFYPDLVYRDIKKVAAHMMIQELIKKIGALVAPSLPWDYTTKTLIIPSAWNATLFEGAMTAAVQRGATLRDASQAAIKVLSAHIQTVEKDALSTGTLQQWGVWVDAQKADYLVRVIQELLQWPYQPHVGVIEVFQNASLWFNRRADVQKDIEGASPQLWKLLVRLDELFQNHLGPLLADSGPLQQMKQKSDATLARVPTLLADLHKGLANVNATSNSSKQPQEDQQEDPMGWRKVLEENFMRFALGNQEAAQEITTIIRLRIVQELEQSLYEYIANLLQTPAARAHLKTATHENGIAHEKAMQNLLHDARNAARIAEQDIKSSDSVSAILKNQIAVVFVVQFLRTITQHDYINTHTTTLTNILNTTLATLRKNIQSGTSSILLLQGDDIKSKFTQGMLLLAITKEEGVVETKGKDGKSIVQEGVVRRLRRYLTGSIDTFTSGMSALVSPQEFASWQVLLGQVKDHGNNIQSIWEDIQTLALEMK